ncbi:ethanolamine utilization protein EutH [Oceanobacillus halophilus]|uniref:Ethanolamine utilization protein EutH n=1 Tax=Oceanobacillus halophilus TaxID=930130 RepID=A0A494ZS89_9BACI|nr:ethanolamine utilization protein EutH [Oceanobacillus halophilus]RKQ28441.1 ethanolamine utilization protein EutH [Oceanobacillus halophilus]
MGINDIIVYIVIGFFCLGAFDKMMGNKWGMGPRFTEGFMAMGSLTLAMVGIISISPVLAKILIPIVTPVYGVIGADPATFANTLLAIDMGGYSLATEMSHSEEAELFAWVFLGTMIGPTLSFTIPVGLGIIKKEDQKYFAKGILLGLTTVPIGCLIGGLVARLDIILIIKNLIPIILLSFFISVGLFKYTDRMIAIFSIFAKGIQMMAMVGLVAICVETVTGIVLIPNMTPIDEGIKIVALIAIFLAGAFPLVSFISIILKKPLQKIGDLLEVNEISTAGMVASLAHHIPMLSLLKDMDPRGKVINVAFAVSGAFVLGGHLGFVAGINQELVFAMIVGKLVGGISAVLIAVFVTNKRYRFI